MKYTVEFSNRVSDSAFIYRINSDIIFGCDIVISSNKDQDLYDERKSKILRFEDFNFKIHRTDFQTAQVPNIRDRLETFLNTQRKRNWNCIEIQSPQELEIAIQAHYASYVLSVKDRLLSQQAKPYIGEVVITSRVNQSSNDSE